MMAPLRMAQYGTAHGHAAGKLLALLENPHVEVAGVLEPDQERQAMLEQAGDPYGRVRWFVDKDELLSDESIIAVACEGLNAESLDHAEEVVRAGKHVWYDKPAGDDWAQWQSVAAQAEERHLIIQMGYMFRYHHGFRQIAAWARSGLLGDVFSIRAHMSTWITEEQRRKISVHAGGIFYDLGAHMLDQIVWMLGRPQRVTAFLRNDSAVVPGFMDNTLGVFEFDRAMAFVDIAAMETRPAARRFEVYGSRGSAILLEPFETANSIRLCLADEHGGAESGQGVQVISLPAQSRQELYELELEAFINSVTGNQAADRPMSHELLVQETLLRATGQINDNGGF